MVAVQEVDSKELIARVKEELKKVEAVKPPAWSVFVKSSISRQRPPMQSDFWYIRAASVLRRVYIDGPIGLEKLRTFYGGRKRSGVKRAHFKKASGSILRKVLQQLEAAGLVEKTEGKVKGRRITAAGRKFLDNIAYQAKKAG